MVTKRLGDLVDLPSAPEWVLSGTVSRGGDALMQDILDGRTEPLEWRYPLRRTDRLAATLGLMCHSWDSRCSSIDAMPCECVIDWRMCTRHLGAGVSVTASMSTLMPLT